VVGGSRAAAAVVLLLGGYVVTVFAAFRLLVWVFISVKQCELLVRVPGHMPLGGGICSMGGDFFDEDGVLEPAPLSKQFCFVGNTFRLGSVACVHRKHLVLFCVVLCCVVFVEVCVVLLGVSALQFNET
jgi:hypothetical protein